MTDSANAPRPWIYTLLFPALYLAAFCWFAAERGPFYHASWSDPDYVYLLNALNLAQLAPPAHIDHPGTVPQLFGALLIRLRGLMDAAGVPHVLVNAENYLSQGNLILGAIYVAAAWLTGWASLRRGAALWQALLLQAAPLLLMRNFVLMTRFNAEPFILILALAMAALLYLHCLQSEAPPSFLPVLLGFVAASGLLAKITFFPVLLIPLFFLRSHAARAVYLASTLLCSALYSLIWRESYAKFGAWIQALFLKKQRYGSGEAGLFPDDYWSNIRGLLLENWVFAIVLLAATALLIWQARAAKGSPPETRRIFWGLAGIAAAQWAQLFIFAKNPESRYLVAAMSFTGLAILLMAELLRRGNLVAFSRRTGAAGAAVGFLVMAAVLAGWFQQGNDMRELRQRREALNQFIHSQPRAALILFYGASSPDYALWFGDAFSGRRYAGALQQILSARLHQTYFLNRLTGALFTADRTTTLDAIRGQQLPVLAWGETKSDVQPFQFLPAGATRRMLFDAGPEAVWQIDFPAASGK